MPLDTQGLILLDVENSCCKDGHIDLRSVAEQPNSWWHSKSSGLMSMANRPGVSGDLEKSDNRFAGMTKAEIKASVSKGPLI